MYDANSIFMLLLVFAADNLLSLALQFLPSCRGKLLLPEVSRHDKLLTICDVLARGGAVLMPYPFK